MRKLFAVVLVAVCVNAYAGDGKIRRGTRPITNRYIVVLNNSLPAPAAEVRNELARVHGAKVLHIYNGVFTGFLVDANEGQAEALSRDPRVDFVEQDNLLTLAASGPTPSWALDRIDDRFNPRLDGTYHYCNVPGERTFVYVFDTGIWSGHPEFSNWNYYFNRPRVEQGFDRAAHLEGNTSANPCVGDRGTGSPDEYDAAHGTAVASLIGGQTMGVAPGAILRPVKVITCDGNTIEASSVARAADWVLNMNDPGWPDPNGRGDQIWLQSWNAPRVVNMSFEGNYFADHLRTNGTTIEMAVNKLIDNNVTVVVAAGNKNGPINGPGVYTVPARVPRAITVAGSRNCPVLQPGETLPAQCPAQNTDIRWADGPDMTNNPGSNYGPEVDVFAPARDVRSAFWRPTINGELVRDQGTSGTSFAAPLVAGMAARYLSNGTTETPQMISDRITNEATTPSHAPTWDEANWFLYNSGGSPRRLLYAPYGCRTRITF